MGDFYTHTLKPWKEKVVEKLNAVLPNGTFNISAVNIWLKVCTLNIHFLA